MTKRLLVPLLMGLVVVLFGALVMALLRGPTGVMASEPRITTRTITIPAGAFSPTYDDADFNNSGWGLFLLSGSADFTAPLFFEAPEVTVKRIILFAEDNNQAQDVCATLWRSTPASYGTTLMGQVCSSGGAEGVRSFSQNALITRKVTAPYGPYLRVSLPGSSGQGYTFVGVRIVYSF